MKTKTSFVTNSSSVNFMMFCRKDVTREELNNILVRELDDWMDDSWSLSLDNDLEYFFSSINPIDLKEDMDYIVDTIFENLVLYPEINKEYMMFSDEVSDNENNSYELVMHALTGCVDSEEVKIKLLSNNH